MASSRNLLAPLHDVPVLLGEGASRGGKLTPRPTRRTVRQGCVNRIVIEKVGVAQGGCPRRAVVQESFALVGGQHRRLELDVKERADSRELGARVSHQILVMHEQALARFEAVEETVNVSIARA